MKCKDPVLCYIKENGRKVHRHFSLASDTFKFLHQLKKDPVFNCGQCLFCRKKRAYELACRCVLHASLYQQNCFLTLTYDEKKETYHNVFEYPDIQKFKKKLRNLYRTFYSDVSTRKLKNYFWRKIEIFNVHEYGKNGKKHWHLIVFNHNFADREFHTTRNSIPYYISETLTKLWPQGHHTIGSVTEASAMYQAQYCEKDFKHGNVGTSKKSDSKHSGLGKPYFLKHYKQILQLGYVPINGKKLPVPRYFQKLAKKHWAHFYEQSLFKDTSTRKAHFRPFKKETPNKEIADLWIKYKAIKEEKIREYEKEWESVISQYLTTKQEPDFLKSANNALYDLRNKTNPERF